MSALPDRGKGGEAGGEGAQGRQNPVPSAQLDATLALNRYLDFALLMQAARLRATRLLPTAVLAFRALYFFAHFAIALRRDFAMARRLAT